ncbi:hypothetical protein GOODEAATRI_031715, partial [Goodea atripinnis]
SDPELASECMDADSSSSVGSEKNLGLAAATVMIMSTNTSSSVSSTASSPSSLTSTMMVGVGVNADGNICQLGGIGTLSNANNENITRSSHYSMAGSSSIGSNNMSNHNNKLVGSSGVWGSQSGNNMNTIGGSNSYINGGSNPNILNPNANHGAWPENPTPNLLCQGQRPSQAQGMTSKLGVVPQQGPLMGWGGMAAPDSSSMMEDTEVNNGTSSSKVLGGSNSGNGSLQPTNLNTEPNGPNNTIMMNTTTTNTTMTSIPPDSTASPLLSEDRSWGSIGGGNGVPQANGNPSLAPQNPQEESAGTGAFGTPWGAATYPVDKAPLNVDTVNPQISSTAAFKSNNNHNNTGAQRWDQGPTNTPNQPQSNLSWNKGSSSNNGWKSLEDDAMGMGGAGGGSQGLGGVTGGWGRSGGSEGSCESSGGRSSSDRDINQPRGGNRRKGNHTTSIISASTQADVDPRVLSNTGWGQTPIRQNTAWDVNSPINNQGPKGDDRKQSSGGSNWGAVTTAAPSQTSGGRNFKSWSLI